MPWDNGEVINDVDGVRLKRLSGAIPYSYTMFKWNSTYYAECNVPDGTDINSSTSATTVLENIIASSHPSVFLKNATYPMGKLSATCSNLLMVGEGNAIIQLANSTNDRFLHDTSVQSNITFRNLIFDFNGANQNDGADREARSGITLENKDIVVFDGCTLKNTRTGAATLLKSCTNVWILNTLYKDNGDAAYGFICDHAYHEECVNVHILGGIYDTCTDVGTAFDNCQGVEVTANYSANAIAGFTWWNRDDAMTYPQGLTMKGCYIDATAGAYCFYTGVAAGESVRPEGVDIIGCHLRGGTTATGKFEDMVRGKIIGGSLKSGTSLALDVHNVDGLELAGVEISDVTTGIDFTSATTRYVRVHDCSFQTVTTPVDNVGTATSPLFHNNVGYVTDNSGTSTGTGAQQTIAHGLDVTPNRYAFANIEDGANPYVSAAADATNIYITAVNTLDYCWRAWKVF